MYIQLDRGSSDTADPVCTVNVLNEKKSTKIFKESLNAVFDQRLTFEFENLKSNELSRGKIGLSVYDSNIVGFNTLIGSCELDIQKIYFNKYHELYQQWIAITDLNSKSKPISILENDNNDNDDDEQENGRVHCSGYLLVTIVVLGPNDEQFIHPETEELLGVKTNEDIKLLNVLMPPQIEYRPYTLIFTVLRAEKLIPLDSNGACDPYVCVLLFYVFFFWFCLCAVSKCWLQNN